MCIGKATSAAVDSSFAEADIFHSFILTEKRRENLRILGHLKCPKECDIFLLLNP